MTDFGDFKTCPVCPHCKGETIDHELYDMCDGDIVDFECDCGQTFKVMCCLDIKFASKPKP